uniref:Thymus-specific serine protease n=1 Tax=Magallana gigas TaxID=29159 RepID=A0A8W8I0N9_MAGGI
MSNLKGILFIILFHDISALPGNSFLKIRELVESQREENAVFEQKKLYGSSQIVEEVLLPQPIDHFDALNSEMYSQKVYINTENWIKPSGPIFLFIGGEGALSNRTAYSGHHVEMAKRFGAMVVAAEHRFYGSNINDNGLHLDQLEHLSSQQGLADLTRVHKYITDRFELTSNKWISFGGSYPGALSAWFRLKCIKQIVEAFQRIDSMIQANQTVQLEKDFLSCGPLSEKNDQMVFVNNLAGIFAGVVQYNNEVPGLNIQSLCKQMTKSDDSYKNLQMVYKMAMKLLNQSCVDNSYSNFLSQFNNQTVDQAASGVGIRQWTWQTCSQFGYYQTCDEGTSCPFSRLLTLESNLVICRDIYKISPSSVPNFVEFTNEYYGANRPKGTRVLFVNGSIDPWHFLSVLKSDVSLNETAVFINGTAHCADMASDRSTDPQSLKDARLMIQKVVHGWLQES